MPAVPPAEEEEEVAVPDSVNGASVDVEAGVRRGSVRNGFSQSGSIELGRADSTGSGHQSMSSDAGGGQRLSSADSQRRLTVDGRTVDREGAPIAAYHAVLIIGSHCSGLPCAAGIRTQLSSA